MHQLPITHFPEPILKRPTKPVAAIDGDIRKLVDAMIRTMRAFPRCVGLAAPQVAATWRIAVMDASVHPKGKDSCGLLVLVNPTIDIAEGVQIQREGCLSVPDFTGNVRRATRVKVTAQDQFGAVFSHWLEGFDAIVAQHEIDHLDGQLFLDRIENPATGLFRRKTYL